MFKHYFKIAFRNLLKQKVCSFINIFGLSLGIACCILVILFVHKELTYDQHHEKLDSLFRVESHFKKMDFSSTPDPLGPALVGAFPEVVASCRLWTLEAVVEFGGALFKEELQFADPSLFQLFTFPLQRGDPKTALSNFNSLILSEEMAAKYFPGRNPLGQLITINLAERHLKWKPF